MGVIWNILTIIAVIFSSWAARAAWNNTKSIYKVLDIIEDTKKRIESLRNQY